MSESNGSGCVNLDGKIWKALRRLVELRAILDDDEDLSTGLEEEQIEALGAAQVEFWELQHRIMPAIEPWLGLLIQAGLMDVKADLEGELAEDLSNAKYSWVQFRVVGYHINHRFVFESGGATAWGSSK